MRNLDQVRAGLLRSAGIRVPGTGGDHAAQLLGHAAISAVNWSEVAEKALERGHDLDRMRSEVRKLGAVIHIFTAVDAESAARLRSLTRPAGLSLGDRACLALAHLYGLPAITADRAWRRVDAGVEVRILR